MYEWPYRNPKHSIIITEDDEDVANTLAAYFKLANLTVYKSKTAIECLNKIKELNNNIDVVYLNGNIAADRGPMLIANIKKLNLSIKIFVLAEDENEKTRVLDYGSDEFTTKPINITTIIEKISFLLDIKPA